MEKTKEYYEQELSNVQVLLVRKSSIRLNQALSIDKALFMIGAQEILQVYMDVQSLVVEVDDPVGSYLLTAWGR